VSAVFGDAGPETAERASTGVVPSGESLRMETTAVPAGDRC